MKALTQLQYPVLLRSAIFTCSYSDFPDTVSLTMAHFTRVMYIREKGDIFPINIPVEEAHMDNDDEVRRVLAKALEWDTNDSMVNNNNDKTSIFEPRNETIRKPELSSPAVIDCPMETVQVSSIIRRKANEELVPSVFAQVTLSNLSPHPSSSILSLPAFSKTSSPHDTSSPSSFTTVWYPGMDSPTTSELMEKAATPPFAIYSRASESVRIVLPLTDSEPMNFSFLSFIKNAICAPLLRWVCHN